MTSGQIGLDFTERPQIESGIRQAESNADQDWRDAATRAVAIVAGCGGTFTSDDVIDLMANALVEGHANPAALGPIFQAAQRRGEIVKTGEQRASRFPQRHRALTVWCAA